MTESLKLRLYRYLLRGHGWISSGNLQRVVAEKTTYSPRTVVRRLEELAEEGKLQVQYRKGHAFYRATESVDDLVKRQQEWARQLPEQRPTI